MKKIRNKKKNKMYKQQFANFSNVLNKTNFFENFLNSEQIQNQMFSRFLNPGETLKDIKIIKIPSKLIGLLMQL